MLKFLFYVLQICCCLNKYIRFSEVHYLTSIKWCWRHYLHSCRLCHVLMYLIADRNCTIKFMKIRHFFLKLNRKHTERLMQALGLPKNYTLFLTRMKWRLRKGTSGSVISKIYRQKFSKIWLVFRPGISKFLFILREWGN